MAKLLVVWWFKGAEEFVFWFVFVFCLFCCFPSYCKGILVSWFQWWNAILAAQWRLCMSCVNHGFVRGLAGRFLGNEGMKIGGEYMSCVVRECGPNFGEERKLSC